MIRISNSEVRPEVLARVSTKPVPVVEEADRTVFSREAPLVNGRLQSNGQVLGRERAGSVRVGEVEAAPFADRHGGPRGAGRLAAAYDRPGIAATASDQRFQLQDPIFVELPSGQPARLGDRYLVYVSGPALTDESQLMMPTAVVQVEDVQPGQLTLARVVRQFAEIRLDQAHCSRQRRAVGGDEPDAGIERTHCARALGSRESSASVNAELRGALIRRRIRMSELEISSR